MKELRRYDHYDRKDIHDILEPNTIFTPQAGTWGLQGIVRIENTDDFVFMVTFGQKQGDFEFDEGITETGIFTWQTQPRMGFADSKVIKFIHHDENKNNIYLFLRTSSGLPYSYLGKLKYVTHDKERQNPVHFKWLILNWNQMEAEQSLVDVSWLPEMVSDNVDKNSDGVSTKQFKSPVIKKAITVNMPQQVMDKALRFIYDDQREIELEEIRNKFVVDYPWKRIQELSLEEYALGSKNSFSNRLTIELAELGSIECHSVMYFGVYHKGGNYTASLKFSKNKDPEEALENAKYGIGELLSLATTNEYELLDKNIFSELVRGKILATYFPDIYLNIYSRPHIIHFLNCLGIAFQQSATTLELQNKLINWKHENEVVKSWSNNKFMSFLYNEIGRSDEKHKSIYVKPSKEEQEINDEEDTKLLNVLNKGLAEEDKAAPAYSGQPEDRKDPVEKGKTKVYPRDPQVAKNALELASHVCEIDKRHKTFTRKSKDEQYTEPHHLVPMSASGQFLKTLDKEENIVSLCSNCHNEIHYGKDAGDLIKILFEKREDMLKNIGIELSIDELMEFY